MSPKISLRHLLYTGSVFFLLMIGLVNYLLFQPHLLLPGLLPERIVLPSSPFFTNHFSDIAWCAALYLAIVILAELELLKRCDRLLFLFLPFMTEIAQGLHFMNGVFDWYDLLLYTLIILFFYLVFPAFRFYGTVKPAAQGWSWAILGSFLFMAVASAGPKQTYQPPKPEPCVTHKAIAYSPVLVKINISGSYTMKDLSGAQQYGYQYMIERLKALNSYKYQLADGVTPNLTLDITVNTDGYQHYGATLYGYVYDGSFNYSWSNDYVTAEKLFDDIASKVNTFISYGWCKNCPSPCNP